MSTIGEQRQAYWRTIAQLYADPTARAWACTTEGEVPTCPEVVYAAADRLGVSLLSLLKDIRDYPTLQPMPSG